MDLLRIIGACVPAFILAVVFDILGIVLLFIGIFANLRLDGRFYGDFLIYSGSLILFFSIGLWLMWYVGNVPVPKQTSGNTGNIVDLARKISQRLSERLKTYVTEGEGTQMGTAKLKTGRVTWGKSTAYVNKGYEQDVENESPSEDRKEELEPEEKSCAP